MPRTKVTHMQYYLNVEIQMMLNLGFGPIYINFVIDNHYVQHRDRDRDGCRMVI